ncbi:DUF2490 domain-containing protein [Arcticibacterium luteifluviistationis]|uniref:DUF2490 domain-containing protein n=1 Tax=Arcticibacterium luteifluviistationis TaxID=1784714 RepID=A0A2Z4GFL0_9BACT|nr:DUF2490 domain-containing protein [Arcticibacterium luteifluviistationis]AWW00183.1 hypothetical protein DJ013_19210 [Arcticibacterium luteifluviistationis]
MKKILLTLFSCTVLPVTLMAQSDETARSQDLETWSGLELEYEITPKLSVSLEPQLRLKENSSVIDTYFGELSGKYDLWKGFSLGAGVRFIKKNDTNGNIQGYENHLRYQFDASYKHSIDNLDVKYRFRYQNKSELDSDNSNEASTRYKLSLDYNFKNWKLDPEVSGEMFRSVEDSQFDKYRLTFGTSYKLGNVGKLKAFYGFENTLNTESLKHTNIIGLNFKHTIKNRKK